MDKGSIITAIIGAFVTILGSYGTYKAAMTKSKQDYELKIEQMKLEAEEKIKEDVATTESIYVSGMEHVINEYKAQVESFRSEVDDLRKENQEIRQQISKLKDERKEITEKLDQERTYYKRELELKDEIIEGLQMENEDLKEEIIILKEDK